MTKKVIGIYREMKNPVKMRKSKRIKGRKRRKRCLNKMSLTILIRREEWRYWL